MSFYKLLGIEPNATEEQIKTAYRKQAMENHPDRNPGDKNAENRFKAIQEAYENLIKTPRPNKTYHKPVQKRSSFSFYDAPPPSFDIWGNPLNNKQKEEWSNNNREHIVDVQNKKKSNNSAGFVDVFKYESGGTPDIRR